MDIFACEIREKKIKEVALVPNWKFTDPRKVVVNLYKIRCRLPGSKLSKTIVL